MDTSGSKDEQGRFCGMRDSDGTFVNLGPAKVGYCGPNCAHCIDFRVYGLEDGVWVCAADSEVANLDCS